MISRTFNKLTRRGKVLKVLREHYLRDDIPCGLQDCPECGAGAGAEVEERTVLATAGAGGAGTGMGMAASNKDVVAQVWLSPEPYNATYLVVDTNVVLHQIDVLEAGHRVMNDVILLQTVMQEAKHRHLHTYGRLLSIMRNSGRRFVPFSNEHHRDTFVERKAGETANDYNDRAVRVATAWLASHFSARGIAVVLLTDDVANAKLARAAGLRVMSVVEYTASIASVDPALRDMVSLRGRLAEEGQEGEEGSSAASSSSSSSSAMVDDEQETASIATASTKGDRRSSSSSSSSRGAAGGLAAVGRRRTLYREHWQVTRVAAGLKSRACFQGTIRVNRDAWFEARVAVHGISGKAGADAQALGGGDDVVSLLILGREDLNRAMEGDTVAVEILPEAQWKQPSTKLAGSDGGPPPEEDEASSSSSGAAEETSPSEPAGGVKDLRKSIARAAARGVVPTARVVSVLRRAWRQYCGSLEPEADSLAAVGGGDGGSAASSAIFVPYDARIPRIRIETRQKAALMDKRIVVAIDGWDVDSAFPRGHYVRTLGPIGDKNTETEVILLEHDIPARPFSQDVLACLPPANYTITPANSAGRRDLRSIPICSVDPPGCKDIDDALHARPLPNGNIEVGVHIADVSHFVKHGTAIDVEASLRANTTYLVERRLDMLPGLLTETLCSLKQHVDRFAFSVTWQYRKTGTITLPDGKTDDVWEYVPETVDFFKSIIHSQASLTYAAAQEMLDDPGAATPVAQGIKLLASIARSLKRARKDAGALTLASPEVRFMLDSETHEPLDVKAYELKETNSMVEEFMLLANCAVAKRTQEAFPLYAMLRRHPAPPERSFDSLLSAAASVGVKLTVGSNKELADSLDAAEVAGNPYFNKLLRILATRCMMQAAYFSSGEVAPADFYHYGLAAPIYTHFTSPIRRYADVIVHRLLAAALGLEGVPEQYGDKAAMKAVCDNMNRRHLMAQLAGRASVALHTNIFFKNKIVVESALVMRVKANGCTVLVPRFGLEGNILLNKAETGLQMRFSDPKPTVVPRALTYNEAEQVLEAADGGLGSANGRPLRIRVFDEIKVALLVEERARFRKALAYRVVDPPFFVLPEASELPPGTVIEDRTGSGFGAPKPMLAAAAVVEAAGAAAAPVSGSKRPREASAATSPAAAPPSKRGKK